MNELADLLTEEQKALIEICWQELVEGNMTHKEFIERVSERIYGKV